MRGDETSSSTSSGTLGAGALRAGLGFATGFAGTAALAVDASIDTASLHDCKHNQSLIWIAAKSYRADDADTQAHADITDFSSSVFTGHVQDV